MKEHQKHWLKPSEWIEQEPKKKKKFFTYERNLSFMFSLSGLFLFYFSLYISNSWDAFNNLPPEFGICFIALIFIGMGAGMMIYAD